MCQALIEVDDDRLPLPAQSIQFLRSNSVATYMRQVRVPTLIGQGQADTLFNLQESIATYTALKRQGTPVSLVWQSWGHSDQTPKPGELDKRHPEKSVQGRQALAWFDFYVRGRGTQPPLNFQYYRDWVFEATGNVARPTRPRPPSRSAATGPSSCRAPSAAGSDGALVGSRGEVVGGTSAYSSTQPIGPNYTETSGLDQSSRSPIRPGPPSASRHRSSPAR